MPWEDEEYDNDWEDSDEFRKVVRNFYSLSEVVQRFNSQMSELNVVMRDFQFALVKLYERYPDLLENSPEGQKLFDASKKLSEFDWSSIWKPK